MLLDEVCREVGLGAGCVDECSCTDCCVARHEDVADGARDGERFLENPLLVLLQDELVTSFTSFQVFDLVSEIVDDLAVGLLRRFGLIKLLSENLNGILRGFSAAW